MAGNRSDAEDILQEAFIIAFKSLHQLKDEVLFGGWLRRIVVNECIRYSKKSFYWQDWDEADHEHRTDDAVEWWQEIDMTIIHQQIKALPDGCRQIFNLYVLEDYSHKQIADNLGVSEGTSKSQYSRAKQLIGLLINFGAVSLEFKRLENPKYNPNLINHSTISSLSQKSQ